jgi:serine/threonine-protein kinase
MSADPDQRFQSALDLRRAVASFRRHRGSIALSDEATRKLAELRALGGAAGERRAHALMTECRFGFTQALQSWPENGAARAGREACVALMIEHEIAQRDAEGARVLYGELESKRPDLLARIDALAAELAATAEREARLRALERDRDLGIGGRAQLVFVAVLPVLAIGGNAYLFWRADLRLSPRDLLGPAPLLANAMMFAAYFVVRRRLRTEISRKALALLVLTPLAWVVHHVFALVLGGSVPMILAVDGLIASLMAAAISITLVPRIGWTSVPAALGILAMLAWPELSVPIFALLVPTVLTFMVVLWRRAVKA